MKPMKSVVHTNWFRWVSLGSTHRVTVDGFSFDYTNRRFPNRLLEKCLIETRSGQVTLEIFQSLVKSKGKAVGIGLRSLFVKVRDTILGKIADKFLD